MTPESMWPGMFQAEAGRGNTASAKSTRNATSLINQTSRIPCTFRACRVAPSCLGLEHTRPHALGCHRLSGASGGKSSDNRQGESNAGEASLVREPVADEVSRRSHCDHSLV